MAAKLEAEIASMIMSDQDINKDTVTRLVELGDFLKTKLSPIIALN
jgi:hypothetical protein